MGRIGVWFFGEEDEIKVKELMKLLNIKDYEKAKKIYEDNVVKDTTK